MTKEIRKVTMKDARHPKSKIPHQAKPSINKAILPPFRGQTEAGAPVQVRQFLACIYPELARVQQIDISTISDASRRDLRKHR
jgi:hypothetical protein